MDEICLKIKETDPTLMHNVPLDTPEYVAFCIMDIMGYKVLFPALEYFGCDGVWAYLMVLAKDFMGSEYNNPNTGIYDCLAEYIKDKFTRRNTQ